MVGNYLFDLLISIRDKYFAHPTQVIHRLIVNYQLFVVHFKKMPLYEYHCESCGEFEAWRSMSEYNAPIDCPDCEKIAIKIFSAPNINLNSGSLSAIAKDFREPRLVKQEPKEPTKPRYQSSTRDRPWMISHAPERL